MAIELKYCKSFKKYKDEFVPEVVDYVREWAHEHELKDFHEDKSLVKVTGTKSQIGSLLEELKDKFGYIPPEDREQEKKGEE